MSASAFAYILLLRGAESRNELMALLPRDRRADVQAVLDQTQQLPPDEIRRQLKNLRDEQLARQSESAKHRVGLQVDHVSPKLYAWLTRPF